LGLNLGQLARTRSLSALKLVAQMEKEFTTASNLDSNMNYGGPDRTLGLLYRDAPSIGSIGNRAKARQHLQCAIELAPEFPDNRLELIESYLKWGNRTDARRQLSALEQIWPKARARFVGQEWTTSWGDWEAQLEKLKRKLEDPSK